MEIVNSNRQMITKFINNVFEFYNGKINTFNKAKLIIDFAERRHSSSGGTSRNPNVITIYPNVIERYIGNDMYAICYNLLISVIHELYHTDQEISYIRLINDVNYKNLIENIVEMNSYLYIANHQQEILENFGLQDNIDRNEYYNIISPYFETGQLYKRRNYYTHLLSIMKDLLYSDNHPILDKFTEAFHNINSIIKFVILSNNMEFYIKIKDECMPVEQLNDILEDVYFKYNLRSANINCIQSADNTGTMNYAFYIDIDCSNFIGKIINN